MVKEKLKIFAEEMEKILDEKFDKYKDGWKFAKISDLLESLDKQLRSIKPSNSESSVINASINERNQRILRHAGNYCLLISIRLGYGEW